MNRFIAAKMQEGRWQAKTANDFRELMHRFFAFAIRHLGFRSLDPKQRNPVADVERLREPAPLIRFLSLEQIYEQLLLLESRPVVLALVATYIFAGPRREEALWLTPNDVDPDRRLIRVQAKTVEGRYWQPNTRRNRAVPMSERLFRVLINYSAKSPSIWYFPSPAGGRWHPDNFSKALRAVNRAHRLDWGCLDFRHTFGSQLAQKGVSLYKIATLMGNSPTICQPPLRGPDS
ncbi:MAG: tyrosine-type recombinase/integrase [Planctomycetes bacterium]|nr:tyrosine-type recombinase/integrase [Planctomycetota bacterium]